MNSSDLSSKEKTEEIQQTDEVINKKIIEANAVDISENYSLDSNILNFKETINEVNDEKEKINLKEYQSAKLSPEALTENLEDQKKSKLTKKASQEGLDKENFKEEKHIEEINKELNEAKPIAFKNTENLVKSEEFGFSKHVENEVSKETNAATIVITEEKPFEKTILKEELTPIQNLPQQIKEELLEPKNLEEFKGCFLKNIT